MIKGIKILYNFVSNYLRFRARYGKEKVADLPITVIGGTHDCIDWSKIKVVSSGDDFIRYKHDLLKVEGQIENDSILEQRITGLYSVSYPHNEYGFSLRINDGSILYCNGIKNDETILHAKIAAKKKEIIEIGGLFKGEKIENGYLEPWYFKHGDYVSAKSMVPKDSALAKEARLTIDELILQI